MTLAELRAITNTLANWLAAATTLLFALSRFLPMGRPGVSNITDDAFIKMLHMAFAERLQFSVEERPFTVTQAMLVISLALLSLIKHSIFMIAVVTVLIIAADNVLRQRRFPWMVLAFAGGIFFFWVLAGQQLNGFGPFL